MMKRHIVALVAGAGLILASAVSVDSAGAARSAVAHSVRAQSVTSKQLRVSAAPLPTPEALTPFRGTRYKGEGVWRAAGRLVAGRAAVYTTSIRLPGTSGVEVGIAWMDTKLLRARLYSGSLSPGGQFWKYTAPISPSASRTLVAAFNGGFLMKDTKGGYFSEGHLVAPLRAGGASLVIYRNGFATVGQWGRDVGMTPNVVAVRQNLTLLVDKGRPVRGLNPADTSTWGSALGQVVNTPRSALGVTKNGALVYVEGPMNIVDLAEILVRAGAIRAMPLDMNPFWTVFATYSPQSSNGLASPANGRDLLATMVQPPGRFFESWDTRDFVTMSVQPS
jgi:hypothetical protein